VFLAPLGAGVRGDIITTQSHEGGVAQTSAIEEVTLVEDMIEMLTVLVTYT
jgi:hypothetical protein